jgi:putative phosphoesterase
MTRAAILSDTHLPRGARRLPVEHLRGADVILHAGDLRSPAVLDELEALGGPVHAVCGNVDDPELAHRLPARLELELDGVRLGMIHDAGPAAGRLARLRTAFGDCDAVVFGHSHIPLHETDGEFQIFNPGSATDRRRQPTHTMGIATIEAGRVTFAHIDLGR